MSNETSIEIVDRIIANYKEIIASLESEVDRLQSELARCKEERLGAEELYKFNYWREKNKHIHPSQSAVNNTEQLITAFRKSQEGKG